MKFGAKKYTACFLRGALKEDHMKKRISDTELEVMRAVWAIGEEASTTNIKQYLEADRAWTNGALQTILARLVDKGFLTARTEGRNKLFKPLISEKSYIAEVSGSLVSRLTRSTVTQIVAAMYENKAIAESDLDELESFIEKKRMERKKL